MEHGLGRELSVVFYSGRKEWGERKRGREGEGREG